VLSLGSRKERLLLAAELAELAAHLEPAECAERAELAERPAAV